MSLQNAIDTESKNAFETPSVYKKYLYGALSGMVEVTTTHWIDVLKTHIQTEKAANINIRISDTVRKIWHQEGFKGFYRGYISRMVGIGPMRASLWGTMDHMNDTLVHTSLDEASRLLTSGAIGGIVQSICDIPVEVTKTQLITSKSIKLKQAILEAMKFRGAGATLSRNSIFAMVMNCGINYQHSPATPKSETITRAAVFALFATFITQPLDYVKTLQQKAGKLSDINFVKLLVQTGRQNFYMLWTGLLSRTILSISTMSVGATTFKQLQHSDYR